MQVRLGEKIRELRKRDGRTQEQLALALGVTNQAVSRWEANGGYPDMEILPSIANYFHVTIDELFGYNGDREEKLSRIITEATEAVANKPVCELEVYINKLCDTLEEFPNEPNISLILVSAMSRIIADKGDIRTAENEVSNSRYKQIDVKHNCQSKRIQRALMLIENTDISNFPRIVHDNIVSMLVTLYYSIGRYDCVQKLADKCNSIAVSREVLMTWAGEDEKRAEYLGKAMIELLQQFTVLCVLSVRRDGLLRNNNSGLDIFKKTIALYESVFSDGNFGSAHYQASLLCLSSAFVAAEMGDLEKGVKYFEMSCDHLEKMMKLHSSETVNYTAPLVDKVSVPVIIVPTPVVIKESWLLMLSKLPKNLREVLVANPRYAGYFEN